MGETVKLDPVVAQELHDKLQFLRLLAFVRKVAKVDPSTEWNAPAWMRDEARALLREIEGREEGGGTDGTTT